MIDSEVLRLLKEREYHQAFQNIVNERVADGKAMGQSHDLYLEDLSRDFATALANVCEAMNG
tara:strand:+ start:147 stop:332 length:186 start_codon:yes stop_codon:yes gene_type:complete